MKLFIQLPCFNEEKTLPQTLADLPRKIDGIDEIEYLIIDDGSTDKTVETAIENGVNHIVNFKQNKGLAAGFMAGLDACLRLGADIIVNTDADNQYCGSDIEKIVKPILDGKCDIVIGSRPIDNIDHFSRRKKMLQHFGSWVVRIASNTQCPDAPSGFRAYTRDAALRMNVHNSYTYTLETIIQAGHSNMQIGSVPIHTNPETRKSRLFKSMFSYIRRSLVTIVRSYMMYKPLRFFSIIGALFLGIGFIIAIRFIVFYFSGYGLGHVQSLVLSSILILLGTQSLLAGLHADLISANRRLLEEIEYRVRKIDYHCESEEKK